MTNTTTEAGTAPGAAADALLPAKLDWLATLEDALGDLMAGGWKDHDARHALAVTVTAGQQLLDQEDAEDGTLRDLVDAGTRMLRKLDDAVPLHLVS